MRRSPNLEHCAAAARACARSATEAVVAGRDLAIVDLVRIDIPEKKWSTIHPLHVELLIKIAVVNLAPPSDANGVSAHEPVNRCWVKRIYQQLHVFLKLMIVPQKCRESPDWHVGDRIEFVKHDAEMREKLSFVIGFQFILRPRQKRADRIVNQM